MATNPPAASSAPPLASLRVPGDASPHAIAANTRLLWQLSSHGKQLPALDSSNPSEEYKSVCEFMRLYSTLRFYQLALLLGTSGSIISALVSPTVRVNLALPGFLKAGTFIASLALLVMEFRASSYWHALRARGNELAQELRFRGFPTSSRWNPLTTTGASFYLHLVVSALWFGSLFVST